VFDKSNTYAIEIITVLSINRNREEYE